MYEAVRESDGLAVVLKGYAGEKSADPHTRTQREFDALCRSAGPGIPRALDPDRTTRRPLLVLERVSGTPLARLLEDGPLGLEAWLDVAVALSEALACVHGARMLHKEVQPGNVLFEPAARCAWLLDFGMAAELGAVDGSDGHPGGYHEHTTLRYIAPEQTGRMNRGCDFRSDLYSLGATLYHAWTGRPPFVANDPLELIHAHIARVPLPARELRTGLPAPLSRIVDTLLRKEPEERYQSARALGADLSACREEWRRRGDIPADFEIGHADGDRPRFSVRLRGRDPELARLRELCARACRGSTEALLLAGGAGMGKSSLVDALRSGLVERGGYLAIGKFDLDQERHYAGWVRALGSLAQQLLLESDARLAAWRDELRAGLGKIAQALIDLVPDLGFVIGEVPAIPRLEPRETQARLSLALHRFLSVCATPQHPLVLSLDDLQWSDAASLALLENLLSELPGSGLLLIASYRPEEVDGAHPLSELLARLERAGHAPERLELGPLAPSAALGMLAEALDRTPDAVRGLADLVERKTANNPLLIRQFIDVIHERGLLRHARTEGWTWDPAAVAAAGIPDGAVALMTAKVDRLEARERAVLELASCAGAEFDAALLCELGRRERTAVAAGLHALCDKGLIMPCPAGFRFVHDRIREAAQQLLSEPARAQRHCEIGRLLLERIPPEKHAARAPEIVEHLNRGLDQLSAEERISTIELNLAAGKRTLAAGAAATAARYFSVARQLLAEDDWATRRELGFELYTQSAECAFLCGELPRTLELLTALDARTRGVLERAIVAARRIQVFALTEPPEDCTRYTLGVLREMGVRWPLHPSRLRAQLVVRLLWWSLRGRAPEQILRPVKSFDPAWFAPLLPLAASAAVLLRVDQRLAALATCFALRCGMRRGYVRAPGFTLAVFAGHACLLLDDPERTLRLARDALDCPGFPPDPSFALRSEQAILSMIESWRLPRRQALAPLEGLAERAQELGDPEFAYYALFSRAYYLTLAGDPVRECDARLSDLAETTLRTASGTSGADDYRTALRFLLSHPGTGDLERALAESDARIAAARDGTEVHARTLWLQVLCVYGRFDLAFAESEKLGDRLFRVVPVGHVVDHTFNRGLAGADRGGAGRHDAGRYRRELRRALRKLRRWARHGPDFVHMAALLAAEHERLCGRSAGARALFEQAAQGARQQSFPHHAALACERRARMLAEQRREIEAASAFRDAIALYREWGAVPKADALAQERRALTGT